jgi:hypothetical protein
MASIAELLAQRNQQIAAAARPPRILEKETAAAPLALYLHLYSSCLKPTEFNAWEEHPDWFRLLVYWLGPPSLDSTEAERFRPHWTQINPQCYRLASMLWPDLDYKQTEQLALRIWELGRSL